MERKNMYLIKNGTVHTGTGKVLEEHDILVEGTKIRKIGKNLCEADAEIIDATGFPWFHRSTFFYRSYGDSDSLQR